MCARRGVNSSGHGCMTARGAALTAKTDAHIVRLAALHASLFRLDSCPCYLPVYGKTTDFELDYEVMLNEASINNRPTPWEKVGVSQCGRGGRAAPLPWPLLGALVLAEVLLSGSGPRWWAV